MLALKFSVSSKPPFYRVGHSDGFHLECLHIEKGSLWQELKQIHKLQPFEAVFILHKKCKDIKKVSAWRQCCLHAGWK